MIELLNIKKPSLIAANGDWFALGENTTLGDSHCDIPLTDAPVKVKWAECQFKYNEFKINPFYDTIWLLNGMIVEGAAAIQHGDQIVIGGSVFICDFKPNFWQKKAFYILGTVGCLLLLPMLYQSSKHSHFDTLLNEFQLEVKKTQFKKALTLLTDLNTAEQQMLIAPPPAAIQQVAKGYKTLCENSDDSLKCLTEFYSYLARKESNETHQLVFTKAVYKYRFLNEIIQPAFELFKQKEYYKVGQLLHVAEEFADHIDHFQTYTAILKQLAYVNELCDWESMAKKAEEQQLHPAVAKSLRKLVTAQTPQLPQSPLPAGEPSLGENPPVAAFAAPDTLLKN